ncbi:MAG TPA: maleylpyruvate isomerase family mycothiol-dependent enzyme [Acidimicrobiales bacterium]|nr:maleylpyruvate isomerase family mycothiol-dependent enzyme [Acidimicrobiales bacterium]
MTDNGAGQDGGFRQQGMKATEALRQTWGGLAEACFELSPNEWGQPTECPGWDVKDQLSHLIGIERTIMGEAAPEWDGPLGDHVKNDFAAVNETWVAVRRPLDGAAVRAEFVEVTETRLGQLGQRTEDEWAVVGWSPVGQVPYAEFMEVRAFDSWVHEQDARRALDRPGGSGNTASALSLGRVESAMPFVVGKKAACPDGTAVRFEIAGPGDDARAFTVAVEGSRARIVDDDVASTATLSLSSLDFLRLGCGRATAVQVEAAGGIAMEGDAAVGRQVLAAMNFMF